MGGCSAKSGDDPERAAVHGTVNWNGSPLESGTISFIPEEGTVGPKTSVAIQRGEFLLPIENGPVVGRNRVEIISFESTGLSWDDEQAIRDLQQKERKPKLTAITIPAIYNSGSTLHATIASDQVNELSFNLTEQGDR